MVDKLASIRGRITGFRKGTKSDSAANESITLLEVEVESLPDSALWLLVAATPNVTIVLADDRAADR